ncbi:MAG: cell division protein FtsQ/DivIB, partial [Candidatus Adiutricales bacterium]
EMETVLDLLNILAERNDRVRVENIAGIKYDRIRGITLRTREGNLQVEVGSKGYRVKFERLGRVLAHLKIESLDRDLAYINLECGPRVIIR